MQLSDLYLYPIKSTAPLPVCRARVEPCGLQHDRRWMVVDADGRFLTGRQLPRLTLVRALPHENGLLLEVPRHAVFAGRVCFGIGQRAGECVEE